MKNILVIGSGAMGAAFTIPCLDNNHDVNIIGTHLENEFIDNLTNILKQNGDVNIVTDSKSYLRQILNLIYQYKESYIWVNQTKSGWEFNPNELQKTKFYKKALKYDRKPIYIKLIKL